MKGAPLPGWWAETDSVLGDGGDGRKHMHFTCRSDRTS